MKILNDFGFNTTAEFAESLFRFSMHKPLLISASMIGVVSQFCITIFGLNLSALLILAVLLVVELITGIWASVKENHKISSRRFQRFGIKILVYFLMIIVFAIMKMFYQNLYMYYVYDTIHSFVVLYIILVYMISILENASVIIGGSREFDGLLKYLRKKQKDL